MTENELNKFRDYSSERLTEVLVDLFLQIDKVHENDFQAYTHFCLTDLSVGAGDRLHIQLTEFQRLNVASRHQNYRDFVAIVCMICTGEGPESYVPGKITSPVLSEIVATLGSGSRSEGDLLYKLRHDYTGGDSFRGDTPIPTMSPVSPACPNSRSGKMTRGCKILWPKTSQTLCQRRKNRISPPFSGS